jgi:hypothetical protein
VKGCEEEEEEGEEEGGGRVSNGRRVRKLAKGN